MKSALLQLEQEKKIPKERIIDAIEQALAAAYKKEYGEKGQIVRAHLDFDSGVIAFLQVKIVVDETSVRMDEGEEEEEVIPEGENADLRPRYNEEHHILLEDAHKIKKDAVLGEEIVFPLETHDDYGRIAAQTAKQVIIQRLREAEKDSISEEFSGKEGSVVSGIVQRIERGVVFIDLGRTTAILPFEEQIPNERYRPGERIKAYLFSMEEGIRGLSLRLSRSHPKFLIELFKIEAPEVAAGVVEIKAVAREPGSRSKIAVTSNDPQIDPIGSCVGQRGVRVSTITNELHGEKIDIIEWSEDPKKFISESISPAKVKRIELIEEEKKAVISVAEEEQSLAIGKGGQNVRLAARLTGWRIDIETSGKKVAGATEEGKTEEVTGSEDSENTEKDAYAETLEDMGVHVATEGESEGVEASQEEGKKESAETDSPEEKKED